MNGECTSNDERKTESCCVRYRLSIWLGFCLIISLGCLATVSYFYVISLEIQFCTDPQCIQSSAEINEFVDDSINPCDDFHEFVCGKFIKTAYERQTSSLLKEERERIESQINNYIIEPPSLDDPHPVIMQKKYFQSCLNEDAIDQNKDKTFFQLIEHIGGWPLLKKRWWKEEQFDWVKVMKKSRQVGLPYDWFLSVDLYDGDQYYLEISRSKHCEGIEEMSDEYINMMTHIVTNLTGSVFNVMQELNEVLKFEAELHDLCEKVKEDKMSVKTILDLEDVTKRFNWIKFITDITGHLRRWKLESKMAYDIDHYISRLNHLLDNTPKKVQANYIIWKMILYFAPYLSKPIREIHKKYMDQQLGEETDRFEFCLADTKSKFYLVSETVFIRNHASDPTKEAGEAMVNSIKEELKNQIDNVEWMNDKTKERFLELYEKLDGIVGGPPEIFEDQIFKTYLHSGQTSFSSNNIVQMLTEWSQTNFYSKIKMIGRSSMSSILNPAYMANFGFKIIMNSDLQKIFLPASISHSFVYDINRPQYLNYGGLGGLIGMELVEALDISNENTSKRHYHGFEENRQCLINSFERSNRELNASLAVKYNYAELVGRDLAYRAYQKFVEDNGEELVLAGVDYTPNQLFWIKSALNWCYRKLPGEETVPELDNILKYRVIEAVKNSPFFGNDFNCPHGSPMNPFKKCPIF